MNAAATIARNAYMARAHRDWTPDMREDAIHADVALLALIAAAEAAEAAYIAQATLRDAAKAAHAVLTTMAPDHLATRALGAALERDQ